MKRFTRDPPLPPYTLHDNRRGDLASSKPTEFALKFLRDFNKMVYRDLKDKPHRPRGLIIDLYPDFPA